MTVNKLKSMRSEMGLDEHQFARLLGLHVRTIRRWENGEIEIPGSIVLLCELCKLPEVRAYLARRPSRESRQSA